MNPETKISQEIHSKELHGPSPPGLLKKRYQRMMCQLRYLSGTIRLLWNVKPKFILYNKAILISGLSLLTLSGAAQEPVAQFRGSERNGKYPDVNLKTSWPKDGPEIFMRLEGIGIGHSSPVVYDGIIYVSGKKDSLDVLSAFDMKGSRLWEKPYGRGWYASYPDTRNTPTIKNNRIYLTSGMGEVVCLDAKSGNEIWKRDPHHEFGGVFGTWGKAESVLLTDRGVISTVGGKDASVVALNRENGELLWKVPPTGERRTYVSPLMIERNGQKIIVTVLSDHMYGINPDNGEILWKFNLEKELARPVSGRRRNYTNTPLYKNGEIFFTSGYDEYAVMLSLSPDGRSVKMKWRNDVLDTHHGGVVEVNGYIYGSNWQSNTQGKWACIEWETGKVMYEKDWHNKGPVIYADGHLYCMEERNGHVALVKADPSGFHVVSSFRLPAGNGPYWAHPVIHGGKLLIRHGDVLMIYDIRDKK